MATNSLPQPRGGFPLHKLQRLGCSSLQRTDEKCSLESPKVLLKDGTVCVDRLSDVTVQSARLIFRDGEVSAGHLKYRCSFYSDR